MLIKSFLFQIMAPKGILPMFQSKAVLALQCSSCQSVLCDRGMVASLLADKDIKLYSTDLAPYQYVPLHFKGSNNALQLLVCVSSLIHGATPGERHLVSIDYM